MAHASICTLTSHASVWLICQSQAGVADIAYSPGTSTYEQSLAMFEPYLLLHTSQSQNTPEWQGSPRRNVSEEMLRCAIYRIAEAGPAQFHRFLPSTRE